MTKKNKKTPKAKNDLVETPKSHLAIADVERFKELLLEKRREIVGSVNEMEDESIKKSRLDSSGDLSSVPIHMADLGSDNFEQEFTLGLMDSERKILREIDEALQRAEDGTYGICGQCQSVISEARLEAAAWSRNCVNCARLKEKGQKKERSGPMFELPEEFGNDAGSY